MGKLKPTDQDIDEIFDLADKWMRIECWFVLDEILEHITEYICKYDINWLVTWATATLAGKHKLEKRKEFLDKCKELYPDNDLWKGLD